MARVSIVTNDMEHCAICRSRYNLDVHHCLHGSYKELAEEDDIVVMLCRKCHRNLHDHGWFDKYLQEEGQLAWMRHNHATVEDFRKRYEKSWI